MKTIIEQVEARMQTETGSDQFGVGFRTALEWTLMVLRNPGTTSIHPLEDKPDIAHENLAYTLVNMPATDENVKFGAKLINDYMDYVKGLTPQPTAYMTVEIPQESKSALPTALEDKTAEEVLAKWIDKESMYSLSENVWPDMLRAMSELSTIREQKAVEGMYTKDQVLKLVEQAYRKGIRDKDDAFLIASQVVAHEIVNPKR